MIDPHNKTESKRIDMSLTTMVKFDELVLQAAQKKRKEIIDRYGPDGCAKVLARCKEAKKEQDMKKNYESTIRNLLESWENCTNFVFLNQRTIFEDPSLKTTPHILSLFRGHYLIVNPSINNSRLWTHLKSLLWCHF